MQRPEMRPPLIVVRPLRIAALLTMWVLVLALASAGAARAQAPRAQAPGAVVDSFGTGGSVTLATGTQMFGVAVQTNGDVVAVGQSGGKVIVDRYTEGGTPAGTYAGPVGVARAVAIQPNGDIVIAGSTGGSMLVERLTSALVPDPTFGKSGMVTAFAGQSGIANAVAIGSDGTVVAAGSVSISPTVPATEIAVAKLSATGASDFAAAFNLGADSVANGVALQPNEDIVLAGSQRPLQNTNGVIARLTSTGTLDTTFAGSGATTYHFAGGGYTAFNAVALQSNGQIVVAGADAGGPNALVLRYGPDGTLDPSFGTAGVAALPSGIAISVPGAPVGAYGVAIAGGGAIVAVGQYEKGGGEYDATAWATDSAGAPQSSFGSGGAVMSPTGLFESCAVAVAPDGTLVAVGNTVTDLPDDVPCSVNAAGAGFLAEYTGFGPLPTCTSCGGGGGGGGGTGGKTPALSASFSGLAGNDITSSVAKHGLRVGVTCNQACSIKVNLGISSGTARKAKIKTSIRKCSKVKGKTKCKTTKGYYAVTIASGSGSLGASGTHTITLKLNKAYVKALEKQQRVTVSLSATVTSTATHKSTTIRKTITFKR